MSETYRLPDGPKTPELLNGLAFLLFRNRVIKKWQRRYGDTYSVRMPGFGTMVLVTTPDLVKQVYTAKPDVLHGGKNPLGEILGPGSLFSMDEEEHLKERRMLLPPFWRWGPSHDRCGGRHRRRRLVSDADRWRPVWATGGAAGRHRRTPSTASHHRDRHPRRGARRKPVTRGQYPIRARFIAAAYRASARSTPPSRP